jgi:predicted nucleic acid-binding protein
MRVIFVDTSFWVAAQNERDGRHGEAVRVSGDIGIVGSSRPTT